MSTQLKHLVALTENLLFLPFASRGGGIRCSVAARVEPLLSIYVTVVIIEQPSAFA